MIVLPRKSNLGTESVDCDCFSLTPNQSAVDSISAAALLPAVWGGTRSRAVRGTSQTGQSATEGPPGFRFACPILRFCAGRTRRPYGLHRGALWSISTAHPQGWIGERITRLCGEGLRHDMLFWLVVRDSSLLAMFAASLVRNPGRAWRIAAAGIAVLAARWLAISARAELDLRRQVRDDIEKIVRALTGVRSPTRRRSAPGPGRTTANRSAGGRAALTLTLSQGERGPEAGSASAGDASG